MAAGFSGGAKLLKALSRITAQASKNQLVKVGFQDGTTYPQEEGKSNPVYVAQVAFWNEYGTKRIPPRPFFRTMIANKSPSWGKNLARLLKQSDYDVAGSLGLMGEAMKDQLQDSILNGGWQANAPATIEAKGFDKPLVHHSIMYRNITYVVGAAE